MDNLGRETMLAEGTPLFFSWSGEEVLTFVGREDTEARLELLDPRMSGRRLILPGTPGNFCAPLWIDGAAYYVTHAGMRTTIVKASPGDTVPTPICPCLLYTSPSPRD